MNMFTLASRNVYRNRLRSLVTTLAMAFACFIMILFSTLMEGMMLGSERQVVEMNMGDIQIHQAGYLEEPDIYATIPDTSAIIQTLEQHGFQAAPRLYASGLLAANMASAGVQLRGIDLLREKKVTRLFEHVEAGSWLSEENKMSVVLGKKLATILGVSLGDELVFIGQSADGYMANDLFYVQGILKSVADGIDRTGVFMHADSFRELMVPPDGAHEIVVVRNDRTVAIEAATSTIQTLVPDAEVKNWKQLMPVIAQMLETADAQTVVMLIITYIAVATIILNAMLMTVFERMHEYGIMKAIGVRPWQIVRLVYAETLIQTLLASSIALIFGWWISSHFEQYGIDMSSFAETSISFGGIAFDPVWYAHITPFALIVPIAFLIFISLLAVIYPATKAATIKPIDAIYFR